MSVRTREKGDLPGPASALRRGGVKMKNNTNFLSLKIST